MPIPTLRRPTNRDGGSATGRLPIARKEETGLDRGTGFQSWSGVEESNLIRCSLGSHRWRFNTVLRSGELYHPAPQQRRSDPTVFRFAKVVKNPRRLFTMPYAMIRACILGSRLLFRLGIAIDRDFHLFCLLCLSSKTRGDVSSTDSPDRDPY